MFRIFMYRRTSGTERSPIEHPSHDDHGNDTGCDPTNYVHHELLSGLTTLVSSGSTSSGAKYR